MRGKIPPTGFDTGTSGQAGLTRIWLAFTVVLAGCEALIGGMTGGLPAFASFVAELGFAFFQKGGHALFLILCGEERLKHPAFEQQPFAQG